VARQEQQLLARECGRDDPSSKRDARTAFRTPAVAVSPPFERRRHGLRRPSSERHLCDLGKPATLVGGFGRSHGGDLLVEGQIGRGSRRSGCGSARPLPSRPGPSPVPPLTAPWRGACRSRPETALRAPCGDRHAPSSEERRSRSSSPKDPVGDLSRVRPGVPIDTSSAVAGRRVLSAKRCLPRWRVVTRGAMLG
jgi:hypothetical protein